MRILFTGDINFRGKDALTLDKSSSILSEINSYIEGSDFIIPNLECPLADENKHKPIKKSGPNLICSPEHISFLKKMKANAVTLANNHIGDFGPEAVKDTLDLLKRNNILYAGAGENIDKAYQPCRFEKDNVSVSVLSVCENEFGIATHDTYGSAGYNPRTLLKVICAEKKISDYVIVVFHGGNEFNPLPSPDTVERYRHICDMGADAIIATHTHCPQGYEVYDGKPIVYSMGNFLFPSGSPREEADSWYYGYMSILDLSNKILLELVPYRFNTQADKISVCAGEDKRKFLNYIEELSDIIKNPTELDNYFMGWAWNHQWCPKLPWQCDNSENYNASPNYNLVSCESHLSQLRQILRVFQNETEKEAEEYAKKIIELSRMPV